MAIVFSVVLFLLPFFLSKPAPKTTTASFPSPTPIRAPGNNQQPYPSPTGAFPNALYVVSVIPGDETQNAPLNQQVLITLNKDFSLKDVEFFVSPTYKYTLTKDGNSLRVTPLESLQSSTIYTYSVNFSGFLPSKTYTFITLGGETPNAVNTYEHPTQRDSEYNLENNPDIVVANNTPYNNNSFQVASEFSSAPTEHFFFTVTLVGGDKNTVKQNFFSWVKGLGITDAQIQKLDIRYQ